MSRSSTRINWKREMAIGAARRKGEQYANLIMIAAVIRRVTLPVTFVAAAVIDAAVLAAMTAAAVESVLFLSLSLTLAACIAGVIAWRRLSLTRGWYMPATNAVVAFVSVCLVSLGVSTLTVWLAS